VGNFTKLQRARQQSFYADAATQLAIAQHQATANKEALVRALGLTEQQAALLKLPDRLPNLPPQPRSPQEVSQATNASRMDIRLAQSQLNAAAKAQGLTQMTSMVDIELGIGRETPTPRSSYEISLKLPLFDFGGLRRDAMNAQTLSAANQLEATVRNAGSNLRESYSAYRTAWDIANHYRQEVLPLRQLIADETLLQYNGMFIGVFDLLAESRNQISGVMAALAAEQQFWLADAALQAVQIGRPTLATINPSAPNTTTSKDAGH
jgi:outer membrane protein TolC